MLRRNSNSPPRNFGRANDVLPVQQEIDWHISRANAQYVEAIKVDGTPIHYWRKTSEGYFCTCRYGHNHAENAPISEQRIDDPNKPVVINNIPNVPNNPNENPGPDDGSFIIRGIWDTAEEKPSNDTVLGGVPVNPPNTGEEGGDRGTYIDERGTEVDKEQDTNEEDAFLRTPFDFDLLSGIEKQQCGICLGTGKTSAWSLYGGKREVFDTHNVISMQGFHINRELRPFSFESPRDETAYVEWIYTLPTYFTTCLNYAVRNNTKSVRDLKIFYKIDGSNDEFQRLTLDFLNSRKGTPTRLVLRVSPIVTSLTGILQFTHIELIWQLAEFQKIQIGPLSIASNPQTADVMTSNSFTFPPSISKVERDDVFFEEKYNRMWKVTDYTDFMTTNHQVLGWTVSARNLQAFEQQSLLKISKDRYYEVSFAGLEKNQGHLLFGNNET